MVVIERDGRDVRSDGIRRLRRKVSFHSEPCNRMLRIIVYVNISTDKFLIPQLALLLVRSHISSSSFSYTT